VRDDHEREQAYASGLSARDLSATED
jgi:hypothetical protein